jgi:hypothetical protein
VAVILARLSADGMGVQRLGAGEARLSGVDGANVVWPGLLNETANDATPFCSVAPGDTAVTLATTGARLASVCGRAPGNMCLAPARHYSNRVPVAVEQPVR